ncbi:alpha-2-macroglobulin-like protein 1 isoform X2 [Mixophyes fleayi]|uniref:alpha-2-macroglobulin-like protein 1 isoform X2 n=1 Tax=Mixophyes fleayi TaxID=3061075 RepID=UPI003F4D8876
MYRMDPMLLRRLLLSLLALGLTVGQNSNLRYLVTAPAVMSYPSNQTVYVHLESPEVETKVSVSLKTKAATIILITLTYKGDSLVKDGTFQVPLPTGAPKEIATIVVTVKSGDHEQSQSKSVMIILLRNGMFVQTDRAIYQPGQKMTMIAAEFTENLIVKNEKFTLVNFQDSHGNIINQWKNVEPRSGIMKLDCNLSPDIALGDYEITVEKNGTMASVTVQVDKYVAPKFEFTLNAPTEVSIVQSSLSINMCGKYTYGKSVRGRITGKVCRLANNNGGKEDICKLINVETNVNGCHTMTVDTESLQFKSNGYNNYIEVEATLEEDGTGVQMKDKIQIYITTVIVKVKFMEPNPVFKLGLVYRGLITVTGADGLPMPDEDIELYVDEKREDEIYTTNKDGVARFSLDTASWENKIVDIRGHYIPNKPLPDTGEVNPVYEDGYAKLSPFYTIGKSQLKIRSEPFVLPCNEKVNLWGDFDLDPSEHKKEYVDMYKLIFVNGKNILNSTFRHNLPPDGGLKGFFQFPVAVTSQMSPAATILLYAFLSNKNLLADSVKIPVSSCFPNPVSLQFSEEQSLPGSMVNLHITAYPNSMCNVRAVDKSIDLLKSEDKHPEDIVNEFLGQWDVDGFPAQLEESQECPHGSHPLFFESPVQVDTYTLFKRPGIKVFTNFVIKKPLACEIDKNTMFLFMNKEEVIARPDILLQSPPNAPLLPKPPSPPTPPPPPPPPASVRKEFIFTWLMNIVLTGPTGQVDYPLKTPDTITQWNVDAFCTATIGLGFSPRTYLQVFKPFFLEMILPYSIKHGETMLLKAIVLNFMKQCIKVRTTLYKSNDFQQEPCTDCSYTACLCSDPTYTFTWIIKPLKLGTINITIGTEALDTTDLCDGQKPIVPNKGKSDIVQRRLIVEPSGLPVENTRSFLLCAFESEKIQLVVPENVVLGSQKAEVTVTGDIMGKPLNHLNNLVKMPQGCGEQNMILLAPTIAAVTYYSITGQLTDEIVSKANRFMESGYQNQLKYKRTDGSYSAFGMRDDSGSTWLTAFVARNFDQARKYIYIDVKHITDALNWLKGLQQEDGCFKNVGRVIHKELQGGVDNQISLTASVIMTYLLIGNQQYDDVIKNAEKCLEKCMEPQSTTYTKALCAYVFTLSGGTEKRKQLLEELYKVAIQKDDKTHWSMDSEIPEDDPLWSKPKSSEVEVTAYVALALESAENPSKADLGAAVPVIRWLNSKQNANGGYTSTTDTVVAISALSRHGALTYIAGSSPVITIINDKDFRRVVSVNPEKPMDVQQVELPNIPAEYTLEASGSGCAYVQVTERHNILEPKPKGIFSLSVETTKIKCPPHRDPAFTIAFNASYNNKNEDSNMALIVVKMVSGYVPVPQSVDRLLANELVKRTETSESEVVIYLDKVGPTQIQLSIQVEQICQVNDLKPATVSLLDYYEPSIRIDVNYETPCN